MNSNLVPLREWIARELQERNWSMRELGRRAGISHAWISNVLNGQESTWDFDCQVARGFGVSPVEALLRSGKITPHDVTAVLPLLPQGRVSTTRQLTAIIEGLTREEQQALLTLLGARGKAATLSGEGLVEQERHKLIEDGLRALEDNPQLLEEFERVIRGRAAEDKVEGDQAGHVRDSTTNSVP